MARNSLINSIVLLRLFRKIKKYVKLLSNLATFWAIFKSTFYLSRFFRTNCLNTECDSYQEYAQLFIRCLQKVFPYVNLSFKNRNTDMGSCNVIYKIADTTKSIRKRMKWNQEQTRILIDSERERRHLRDIKHYLFPIELSERVPII